MKDSSIMQRRAALKFARSFDDMDDETTERIIKLLERKEKN